MKIKKIDATYDVYNMEISFGEMAMVLAALERDHSGPVADEMYNGLKWYIDQLPGPGEDKEDLKKDKEAEETPVDEPLADATQLEQPDVPSEDAERLPDENEASEDYSVPDEDADKELAAPPVE